MGRDPLEKGGKTHGEERSGSTPPFPAMCAATPGHPLGTNFMCGINGGNALGSHWDNGAIGN